MKGKHAMSRYATSASPRLIAGGLSAGLLCAATALAPARKRPRRPAGFSAGNAGWVTIGTD
jgi:hypothetical protein